MKWFKHESKANRENAKKKLIMKYGAEGYGLYWYCLEQIGEQVDATNLTFELEHDCEILAHDLSIESTKVEEMMRFMIDKGLFESPEPGVITCFSLAEKIESSVVKSPQLVEIKKKIKEGRESGKIPDLLGLSRKVTALPRKPGTKGEKSCLDLDLELEKDITTTTTSGSAPASPINAKFRPSQKSIQFLLDEGVTPEYLDTYLPRFIRYWLDNGKSHCSWDSVFMEQCSKQFEREAA